MSKWIWKFGDFEMYHSLLVHNRRQQYGYLEPVIWKMYQPEPVVNFRKEVTTEGGTFRIRACGDFLVLIGDKPWNIKRYGGQTEIPLEAGTTTVTIRVSNLKTFPCIYVDGVIESDETWLVDDMSQNWEPVGTYERFHDREKSPEVFPFAYEKIDYMKKEKVSDGILFDFGRETFAKTTFFGMQKKNITIQFGESREEALDEKWAVIQMEKEVKNGEVSCEPYAFRYIYVNDVQTEVKAEYEYLPLEYRGEFHCDEEIVNRVWDVAAYTFHLNSREFFLDGIKRDRWVWAADAYQSLFVNRYLFFDKELEQRTLIALGGKSPFRMHINTIMDYSFFWIMSLYEHYETYGDKKFLKQMVPQMKEVMQFCENRTDADGFMRGKPGDWIFIDWASMDKTGALCGEQILYAKAMECYSKICEVTGEKNDGYAEKAEQLRAAIFEKFYDPEKKVFIDSYESGKRNVTRHSNILAYLFLGCSAEQKKDIYERVVLNNDVAQITTPYFKFYENQVHCQEGNTRLLEESIRVYYGSMLESGATTLYEEYNPEQKGVEHYAMYGNPFQKSLCHAWSASPIYLLGNYRLGVQNTGIAYETFDVCPMRGDLKTFSGKVPVPGGSVTVSVDEEKISVFTDVKGGTLRLNGKSYELEPGKEITIYDGQDKEKKNMESE